VVLCAENLASVGLSFWWSGRRVRQGCTED
jgi:hypothetical protein